MARMGGSQLWAVRTTGEGKRLISEGDGMGPKWSPDGRWIAYWGVRLPTLAARPVDGGRGRLGRQGWRDRALTDDASIDWGVEWSPDGRFLYFSSNRGGTMNLLRIPIDPRFRGRAWRTGADDDAGRVGGSLSFAKDGRRLAFGTREWRADAWKVAFDPDRETLQGRPLPILRGQPLQELDWSPDGTWLVVRAPRSCPGRALGSFERTAAATPSSPTLPFSTVQLRWSPDGQRIAFQSQRGDVHQVWVMRTDGSALQQVSRGRAHRTAWCGHPTAAGSPAA